MALTKCINSESKQYKPVLVDKLILDDVPTVNSLNAITSDAVARAVAGASGEVPAVTENDNGKVLKAIYDEGGPAVEWGEAAPAVTVDQTYNALSENPQSGIAVAEAVTSVDKISTVQASGTEIDIAVTGNAPLTLIAEDYDSIPGPSTTLSFSSAEYISTQGGNPMYGIHVVFDLPSAQTLPVSARLTVNQDIVGSDTRYSLGLVVFGEAEDDFVRTNQATTVDVIGIISSDTTLLAGNYDVTLSTGSGNPGYSFTQVGFVIMGHGQEPAWSDFVNYIITNASTLFSMSVPTTVKTARLLPAASSIDANKVLTVNASGKPEWATATVELPSYSDADAGKVLQVQDDGSLAWVTLS